MSIPDAAKGAIGAALITGVLTALGLILAKESKTSEFRQAWIDALRVETATLLANVHVHEKMTGTGVMTPKEYVATATPILITANVAISSIRLRLNTRERLSREFLELLDVLERELQGSVSAGRLRALERAISGKMSDILKAEWDRVRAGEPAFRHAVKAAKGVAVAAASATAWLIIRYLMP